MADRSAGAGRRHAAAAKPGARTFPHKISWLHWQLQLACSSKPGKSVQNRCAFLYAVPNGQKVVVNVLTVELAKQAPQPATVPETAKPQIFQKDSDPRGSYTMR